MREVARELVRIARGLVSVDSRLKDAIRRRNLLDDGRLVNREEPTDANVKRLLDRGSRKRLKDAEEKLKAARKAAKEDPGADILAIRKYVPNDSRLTTWREVISFWEKRVAGGKQYIEDVMLANKVWKEQSR